MATVLVLVLLVCAANLVFTVRTWKMARDERRESGEALRVPRGKPEKPGKVKEDATRVAESLGVSADEFDEMLDMVAQLRRAEE